MLHIWSEGSTNLTNTSLNITLVEDVIHTTKTKIRIQNFKINKISSYIIQYRKYPFDLHQIDKSEGHYLSLVQ